MTGFARFNKQWASTGATLDPTDSQANAGFAFLGATPPSVELFNALLQDFDDKDNILYNWIAAVLTAAGITPADATPGQLLLALRALRNVQVITASTTFIVPAPTIDVELWGGGGGSGGVAGNISGYTSNAGGSGSGGGYARKLITGLTVGASVSVTIGAGGNGSVGGSGAATSGGTTSFGAYVSATGGSYGTNGTSVAAGLPSGGPGIGIGGDLNISGGQGGGAFAAGSANIWTAAAPGYAAFMPATHLFNGDNAGIAATMPGCAGTPSTTSTGLTSSGGAGFRGLCNVRW